MVACPRDCEYLVAAEEKLRERRARELSRDWEKLIAYLREKGREHLVPLLDILREAVAHGLHKLDVEDDDVIAALEYCAGRLSPIELLEQSPNILGRALEETLIPLVQRGVLDREKTRKALEILAGFAEMFAEGGDGKKLVRGLLGLYPPPKEPPSPIVSPSEDRLIVRP